VCTVGGGGGTLTKPVLSVNSILYILRQESVIKYIAVFKVITGSNLCLFTALGFLWMFWGRRPSSMGMYIYFTFVVQYCASEIPSALQYRKDFLFCAFLREWMMVAYYVSLLFGTVFVFFFVLLCLLFRTVLSSFSYCYRSSFSYCYCYHCYLTVLPE
jgi:hypothetical protein